MASPNVATPLNADLPPKKPAQSVDSIPLANTKPAKISWHTKSFFLTLKDWDQIDLNSEDHEVLVGTPQNAIIRPGTKNLVVAPEKTFKTTVLLRLVLGIACKHTVYSSLPIARPARVLYIHGEMTPKEIAERTASAKAGIPTEALKLGELNFIEGRSIDAHLIKSTGQDEMSDFLVFADRWGSDGSPRCWRSDRRTWVERPRIQRLACHRASTQTY